MKQRIESLDWLRGMLAAGVMLYHYCMWSFGAHDSGTVLGRIGIYGVAGFYVLSGLSLSIVYGDRMCGWPDMKAFFIRRLFRILPLLWVANTLVVLFRYGTHQAPFGYVKLALNYTGLFGFVKPSAAIATGAWSIGNELVYYVFFPLFIVAFRHMFLGHIAYTVTLLAAGYFASVAISPSQTLASQWVTYVNPFNNLYLFVSGIVIHKALKGRPVQPLLNYLLFTVCVLTFWLYPMSGDQAHIVTGLDRIVFSLVCIGLVASFYAWTVKPVKGVGWTLNAIGMATYSVYLLHPFVYTAYGILAKRLPLPGGLVQVFLCALATFGMSLMTYHWFEVPFIQFGKRLTPGGSRPAPPVAPAVPSGVA